VSGTRVEGKVAIVTGAASGIGAATATLLAAEGAAVVVADVDGAGATAHATRIMQQGGTALAVVADVADEAAIEDLVAATVSTFGSLDIIHNNAAATALAPDDSEVGTADVALWRRTFDVNVLGTMLLTKHALPHLIAAGSSSIVNMSSAAAYGGFDGLSAYSASKAAVIALTRTVATQYGKQGVRCNAVVPGQIRTMALERTLPTNGRDEALAALRRQVSPILVSRTTSRTPCCTSRARRLGLSPGRCSVSMVACWPTCPHGRLANQQAETRWSRGVTSCVPADRSDRWCSAACRM
jgi:NAD(P)-dependent dehydrogenase (short-subunit alcohol dehydrogenase family)